MVQFVHTLVEDGEHGTFIENYLKCYQNDTLRITLQLHKSDVAAMRN